MPINTILFVLQGIKGGARHDISYQISFNRLIGKIYEKYLWCRLMPPIRCRYVMILRSWMLSILYVLSNSRNIEIWKNLIRVKQRRWFYSKVNISTDIREWFISTNIRYGPLDIFILFTLNLIWSEVIQYLFSLGLLQFRYTHSWV